MRRAAALATIALAAALVGCGDPAASAAGETYVLRSIAGDAIPAVFNESDAVQVRILADTLVLAESGIGHESQRVETLTQGDGSLDTYDVAVQLTWIIREGRLEIAYECPDFASCIAPPHLAGTVTASGLAFDISLGRAPLIFERLPD